MTNINRAPFSRQQRSFRLFYFLRLKKSTIVETISLFFVILFLYTGISKLLDFEVFKAELENSPVLEPVAAVIAFGLPTTEFIVSLLLFFPAYRIKGLYAALVLMMVFTCYVIALLTTSTDLPCSCGGIMEQLSWQGHLIVNISLVILSFIAVRVARRLKQSQGDIHEERLLSSYV